ncbi:hypothetical protein [Saccharopolyspora shandongensis]|uniref:hypothetical protein n=1 Tax=Saccharopolyspora shandongensis TaxID=418495 RepID=UPI0033C04EBD
MVESLGGVLAPTITPNMITRMRQVSLPEVSLDDVLSASGVQREDVMVAGHESDEILVSSSLTGGVPAAPPSPALNRRA